MKNRDFPHDVIQNFKCEPATYDHSCTDFVLLDNEMDGESLKALLLSNAGPDCLKELIPKLGIRLRIYKQIKSLLEHRAKFKFLW